MRVVAAALVLTAAHSLAPPASRMRLRSGSTVARGGGGDAELKDYSGAASGLFGTYRIPASLFAGASAGAAFAMPIGGSEAVGLAVAKRAYLLLMINALACQLQTILVATVAIERLANDFGAEASLEAFVRRRFNLEWLAVRYNFFYGVVSFVVGVGIRAWTTVGCPVFGKVALYTVLSGALTALAFIKETEDEYGSLCEESFMTLPVAYVKAYYKKARRNKLFGVAGLASMYSLGYLAWSIPHVGRYLLSHQG